MSWKLEVVVDFSMRGGQFIWGCLSAWKHLVTALHSVTSDMQQEAC